METNTTYSIKREDALVFSDFYAARERCTGHADRVETAMDGYRVQRPSALGMLWLTAATYAVEVL
jgi:hypothetical protein